MTDPEMSQTVLTEEILQPTKHESSLVFDVEDCES